MIFSGTDHPQGVSFPARNVTTDHESIAAIPDMVGQKLKIIVSMMKSALQSTKYIQTVKVKGYKKINTVSKLIN